MNLCSFSNDVNSIDEGTNKHILNQKQHFPENSFPYNKTIDAYFISLLSVGY